MEVSHDSSPVSVMINGINATDVTAQTFSADALSEVMPLIEKNGLLTGTISGSGPSTVLMFTFAKVGTYWIEVSTHGRHEGIMTEIIIENSTKQLFGEPVIDEQPYAWINEAYVNDHINFTLSAPVERWDNTSWGTYYNWTIDVVSLNDMNVGNDLSKYNTGDTRVDCSDLDHTTVVSAWENGFNTLFITPWDKGGNLISGKAAMTPNGKELTMTAGTYDEWSKGRWEPYGSGMIKFNESGHYLIIIYLSDANGPVSRPLLLESIAIDHGRIAMDPETSRSICL
ncbi:MAG: hypothetical protein GX369_07955 [Euryarchaeota archaeon]|nr:hypothetical protein [Euryarchaeota archaeon]